MSFHGPVDIAQATAIREGSKVAALVKYLAEIGITHADEIDIAIDSETNFVERIEKLLQTEGEIDGMIDGLAAYITKLNARMKNFKAAKEATRDAISEALDRSGREKVQTFAGTLYLQADPREVRVINEAIIPAEYFVEKLDTGALNKAARARYAARQAIIDEMGEYADVELILALWDFDDENPEIEGVEIGELTRSMRIRRA